MTAINKTIIFPGGHKDVMSDDRLVYDKSYNNFSESYVRAVTLDNQIKTLHQEAKDLRSQRNNLTNIML